MGAGQTALPSQMQIEPEHFSLAVLGLEHGQYIEVLQGREEGPHQELGDQGLVETEEDLKKNI